MTMNSNVLRKRSRRSWAKRWSVEEGFTFVAYLILTVWAILALFPMYWMLKTSFEPPRLLEVWPPHLLPDFQNLSLRGYRTILERLPIARWFFNSALVSVSRTAGTLLFGSMAGYAFAKLRFWGREALFWGLMTVIMIPGFVTIVPLYQVIFQLGWIDTYWALIIPGITGGTSSMFLMRQFLRTLPTEMIESARIDGANDLGIFVWLILPLAKPGLAVLGIFSFMGNWNTLLWPLLVTKSLLMRTMSVGMSYIQGGAGVLAYPPDTGQIMAGATITGVPMILVFLAFQGYFLKGITIGAIKG